MFSKIVATLLLSASAWAYTTPTTFNVTSNPIYTPTLGEIVPVGKAFKITWGPTESETVSIVLLRGPSENVQPLYAIAEKIENSGSFEWTPKSDLVADTTHYGLQLIKDSDGQFQYSVQFGISNPNVVSSSSSAATSAKTSSSAEPTTTSTATVQTTVHSSVTSVVYVTSSSASAYITSKPATTLTSSYAPSHNSTATSSKTSPTYSNTALPTPTPTGNAASALNIASGLLMGVAGVAAMLL